LTRVYSAPVREQPKKPIEEPKPTQQINSASIAVLVLTIVVMLIAGGMLMSKMNEVSVPEVEEGEELEIAEGVDVAEANFETSQIAYMKGLLEFTEHSSKCFNGKLDKVSLVVVGHVQEGIYIRSVELNERVAEDWTTNLVGDQVLTNSHATLTIKVPRELQMAQGQAVPIKIFVMGDSGIYQQTKFVPDLSRC